MLPYLDSPSSEIFRVEENGGIWIWTNNESTAAFGIQLAEILEETAALLGGIPSLTSVLCVATALRHFETYLAWESRIGAITAHAAIDAYSSDAMKTTDEMYHIIHWLNGLASFSGKLRSGPVATSAILACGLQGRRDLLEVTSETEIGRIIQFLRLPNEDRPALYEAFTVDDTLPLNFIRDHFRRAWETLACLRLNVESETQLECWRRTGLKQLPVSDGDETIEEAATFVSALADMEQQNQYAGLVRFSRRLAGMIALPRRPADPDDLPIGGVSDVTNRGTPERLLMTELAADPMLMLARIANGQALYLRREMPPGPTARVRQVLVEATIQCWGISRVRMAAFALAVAISERNRMKLDAKFLLMSGDSYKEIDSTNEKGLIALIEELSPEADPGQAFKKFLKDDASDAETEGERAEPLVVVTASTFRAPDFQRILHDVTRSLLLAVIDRSGFARIIRWSPLGQIELQSLQVDLDAKQIPIGANSASKEEPIFVKQRFPPLAFSGTSREVEWMVCENDSNGPVVWQVTPDQRLLYYCKPIHGGEEITDLLPASIVLLSNPRTDGVDFVLADHAGQHFLVKATLESHDISVTNLGFWGRWTTYAFSGKFLLQFTGTSIQVFSCDEARRLATYESRRHHVGCGYQVDDNNVLSIHGGAAAHDWHQLNAVDMPESGRIGCVLPGLDNELSVLSNDLKWAVAPNWTETGEAKATQLPQELAGTCKSHPWPVMRCADGKSWIIRVSDAGSNTAQAAPQAASQLFFLDVPSGRAVKISQSVSSEAVRWAAPKAYHLVRRKPVRRRARAVSLWSKGIVFEKEAGSHFTLTIASDLPRRLKVERYQLSSQQTMVPFGEPYSLGTSGAERKWTLRRADLPGGTCWLDSRGIFHFRRDNEPAELSLVFSDSHVAGWFSQSGLFGPRYFFPPSTQLDQEVIVGEGVIQWLQEWWQAR